MFGARQKGCAAMNVIRLIMVAFLPILFLSGCIDLELVTQDPPDPPLPYGGDYAYISCEDAWGWEFTGSIARQPDGRYLVDFLELGANPIALPYDCKVRTIPPECCTPVSFDGEHMFKELSLTMYCGLPNPCASYP